MDTTSTAARLDALLERHAPLVERLIARFDLPLHVLFLEEMAATANAFLEAARRLYPRTLVSFAVKANPCRGAIRAAKRLGLGADVASEHELRAALEEGIEPDRIVCNGNAKSQAYLRMAAESRSCIALDNADELRLLQTVAKEREATVDVLVRFRGMPLAGLTSDDQTTAADWTKFGFHVEEADDVFSALRAAPTLRFVGVSAHIGTQITDPTGYHRLLDHLLSLTERARAMGLTTDRLNIGGGFPVRFLTEFEWRRFTGRLLARLRGQVPLRDAVTWNDLPLGYAHLGREEKGEPQWIGKAYWTPHPESTMLEQVLEHRTPDGQATVDRLKEVGSPRLIVEPGRSLVGPAGVTLTRVTGTKEVLGHHVVSLDMGINNHGTNLIAPDIFSAAVLPRAPDDRPAEAYLAGRLCFSGDMISKAKVLLNRLPAPGERFAIYHTGAYGADHFASHSCGFPRPAKVAIREDGTAELWRRPDQFEDVFGAPDDLLDAS